MEDEAFGGLNDTQKKWLGSLGQTMAGNPVVRTSHWFRHLLGHDPRHTLARVRCPVLAATGSRDVQVPAARNLPLIAEALALGGHQDYTVRELPNLNHMLQNCETGAPTEYGQIEETVAPIAMQMVGDWILKTVIAP